MKDPIYVKSLEVVRSVQPLLWRIENHDDLLASRLRNAATFVTIELASRAHCPLEDRVWRWEDAMANASVVCAALEVSEAAGYLKRKSVEAAIAQAEALVRMMEEAMKDPSSRPAAELRAASLTTVT